MVAVRKQLEESPEQEWRSFLAPVPAYEHTLSTWIEYHAKHLELKKSKSLREAKSVYKRIAAAFGEITLSKFTQREIVAWIEWLKSLRKSDNKPRYANKTIRKFHSFLRSALGTAVAAGLMSVNPACHMPTGVLPPNKTRPEFDAANAVLSAHDASRLVSSQLIPSARRALYAMLLFTGAREGEVLGIFWRHWNRLVQPLSKLRFEQQWSTRRGIIDTTKTDDPRDVPVHLELAAILEDWWLEWSELYGRHPEGDDLIFPRSWGGELKPQYQPQVLTNFKKDLERLGLPPRSIHALRHTFTTLTVDAGAEENVIFALTHRDSSSIRDTYRHWQWPRFCEAVATMPVKLHQPMHQLELIQGGLK